MKLLAGLGILGTFLFTARISADTLFKEKVAIAFGHGIVQGRKIHWTDCSGQNTKDYDAPPYWLDKADNCSLRPYDVGLAPSGSTYVVSDEKKFQWFFPNAKAGHTAMLHVMDTSVEITYEGKTVTARK